MAKIKTTNKVNPTVKKKSKTRKWRTKYLSMSKPRMRKKRGWKN